MPSTKQLSAGLSSLLIWRHYVKQGQVALVNGVLARHSCSNNSKIFGTNKGKADSLWLPVKINGIFQALEKLVFLIGNE
uniref:HDC07408 n=1 Tax=Drosophila melanogaster TaxID=7227 RepID=Q6IG25_DROME|nr:TPA_inf: HDC07408 [Drosophila melanogaster]